MQDLCVQLIGGSISLPYIYIYMQWNSMQGLYAQLTRGFISLLICIVLDLAVGVAVCKASVLD